MKLVEFCLKNPVTVTVGIILALLFGGIALFRIPLQMTPTVDRPEITVETIYPGASPREVEEEIVDRQEEQLNAVENLREMTSTSFDGRASVVLKFDWGTNKDIARLDVSEKLNLVKEIPEDAEEPVIRAVNSDEARPVAWIIMRTSRNINEVRPEAEDVIKPHLERVKGVGSVWMFGGQEREVRVALDHRALAARGISIRQVRDALIRENRNIKGGKIDEGKRRHVVRTVGQFPTLREMESTIVAQEDGRPVYLRDVARVSFDYKDLEFFVRQGGLPTIGFGVLRKTGANVVEVMRGVKSKLDYLNNKLYRGKDIYLELVYDETVYIKESVNQVVKNLLFGVGLAFLVLIFFLRSPRSALIISFAMPISIVTTFIFLDFLGRSLNIISLAGLAFAVGMVVDNSVVVLENIFRHREMGKPPFRAALDAAGEVWGAVLAASLTTMAVFVPIIFVKEEAGQLFRDIAITIAVAIFISLIVALTVLPMLSARFLRVRAKKGEARRRVGPLDILLFTWVGWLISWLILGANGWLARGVARRLAVTFLIVGASVWLAFRYAPPMDYLPAGNRNLVFCLVKSPPGFNLKQNEMIVRELEERFSRIKEIERLFSVVRPGTPFLGALAKKEYSDLRSMQRLVRKMREASIGIPGTPVFVSQVALFQRRGFIGGVNVEVDVKGDSLAEIQRIASAIEEEVGRLPGVNFVNSSFELGNPELQVQVDREKAADLNLSVAEVGYIVETLINGTKAGTFRENGKELDITLRGEKHEFDRTQDLERIVLNSPLGRTIFLSDIARLRETTGPTRIQHTDRDRSIKLTVNLRPEVPMERAVEMIDRRVVQRLRQELPLGYSIEITGQAQDLDRTWDAVKWSFLLALVISYLLMCSLFESFTYPFIIMFSVPMAATGGILAVKLANSFEPLVKMDVITMLGFVILVGIVVNNAILLVHQALNNMRAGSHYRAAILDSCRVRIRPIFMSTISSIFGMLPLVLSSGSGSELYRGLGSAVVGGLLTSTIFTLILVPIVFTLWMDMTSGLRHLLGRPEPEAIKGEL